MRVCMIGTGYVGLVTGACLAEQGNHVWCVDIDEDKISRLNAGVVPIYEPGLEDIIKRNVSQGRLKFTTDTKEAVKNSFFVFIAVGTPPDGNGNADLKYVMQAAQNIGACMEGKPIDVYNNGNMKRDFTYVDDIVEGVIRVLDKPAEPDLAWSGKNPKPNTSPAPYRIYNIGNSRPVDLMDFINAIEEALGKKAKKHFLPMQEGDVPATWADVEDLETCFGYRPKTAIKEGIGKFVDWYEKFYEMRPNA